MTRSRHIALSQMNASLMAKAGDIDVRELENIEIPFGRATLNVGDMAPHSVLVGSTGTGKTILQKSIIHSVLPAAPHLGGLNYRAAVYDPKRELYPYLIAAGIPPSQIIITHPFDDRSAAWNLAADFREPAQIEELAQLIVPQEKTKGENEFFHSAARILVQEVIEGLRAILNDKWTLRDVTEACSKPETLLNVLNQTENGRESAEVYFGDDPSGKMSQSVRATLHNYVRPFHTLAALWHHSPYEFSLSEWHRGSGVLLLGADPRRQRTLQRINRLMVQRISQLVLGREDERPVDLTWLFFDEVREAGKLAGLRQLMTEGRSKGARVVLGFQDTDGMKSFYGEHETREIIGLCANRIVLHLDNTHTQNWATEVFGKAEVLQIDESSSKSTTRGERKSVTEQEGDNRRIAMRSNALPIEFQSIPLASLEDGVHGWFAIPGRRNQFHFPPDLVAEHLKLQHPALDKDSGEKNFVERPTAHQKRARWSDDEKARVAQQKLEAGAIKLGGVLEDLK